MFLKQYIHIWVYLYNYSYKNNILFKQNAADKTNPEHVFDASTGTCPC